MYKKIKFFFKLTMFNSLISLGLCFSEHLHNMKMFKNFNELEKYSNLIVKGRVTGIKETNSLLYINQIEVENSSDKINPSEIYVIQKKIPEEQLLKKNSEVILFLNETKLTEYKEYNNLSFFTKFIIKFSKFDSKIYYRCSGLFQGQYIYINGQPQISLEGVNSELEEDNELKDFIRNF